MKLWTRRTETLEKSEGNLGVACKQSDWECLTVSGPNVVRILLNLRDVKPASISMMLNFMSMKTFLCFDASHLVLHDYLKLFFFLQKHECQSDGKRCLSGAFNKTSMFNSLLHLNTTMSMRLCNR